MIDAIEPWAREDIVRQQLLDHAMTIHRTYLHQAELHRLDDAQATVIQHNTVTDQHVDVDV